MQACKDCSCSCDTTTRDGSAPQCDTCAHDENLGNAVDQFLALVVDVTLAQLRTALDSYLYPVC